MLKYICLISSHIKICIHNECIKQNKVCIKWMRVYILLMNCSSKPTMNVSEIRSLTKVMNELHTARRLWMNWNSGRGITSTIMMSKVYYGVRCRYATTIFTCTAFLTVIQSHSLHYYHYHPPSSSPNQYK